MIHSKSVVFTAGPDFRVNLFYAAMQDVVDPGRKNFGLMLDPETPAKSMTILTPNFKVLAVASTVEDVRVFIHIESSSEMEAIRVHNLIEKLVKRIVKSLVQV